MSPTVYDEHAEFYVDFVDRGLASEDGYVRLLRSVLASCVGERIVGARVCDLCCGEGYLGRFLMKQGATSVVGVDASSELVEEARRQDRVAGPRCNGRHAVRDADTIQAVLLRPDRPAPVR